MDFDTCLKLTGIALVGSFLCSLTGAGPGMFFNTIFVQLGMNLKVISATANYLALFTTFAASINSLILKTLNLQYSILVNLLVILATIPGVYVQDLIMRKSGGRTQFSVIVILSFTLLTMLSVLPVSVM